MNNIENGADAKGSTLRAIQGALSRSLAGAVTKNAPWAALGCRPARRFTQIVFVPALDGLSSDRQGAPRLQSQDKGIFGSKTIHLQAFMA
jgi:hypothetical protein